MEEGELKEIRVALGTLMGDEAADQRIFNSELRGSLAWQKRERGGLTGGGGVDNVQL